MQPHFGAKYLLMLTLQNLRWSLNCCCVINLANSLSPPATPPPLSPYKFNEKIGGGQRRLVYGDILLSPRQIKLRRLMLKGGGGEQKLAKHIALKPKKNNRWPDNEIPFIFSVKFNERQKRAIREALAVLEDSSCFRFIPRSNQRDFLFIDMLEGCFSFVGKVGGRQLLSLAAGCLHDYIIWHEVMHALGLEHEHQRPDRDKFIRIHWENVEPEKHLNFEKIPPSDVDLYHNAYDYHSLMHYDGTAFGKTDQGTGEPMTTMEPLRDGVKLTDNFELTNLDVEKLKILSKCKRTSGTKFFVNQKSGADHSHNELQSNFSGQKFRPGMDAKLVTTTDPGTVEQPALVQCADRSTNCDALKKHGFCWEIRYVRLIRIQCQHTCGFCENGGTSAKKPGSLDETGGQNDKQGQDVGHPHENGMANIGGQDKEGASKNGGQDWEDYDNKENGAEWEEEYGNVIMTSDEEHDVHNNVINNIKTEADKNGIIGVNHGKSDIIGDNHGQNSIDDVNHGSQNELFHGARIVQNGHEEESQPDNNLKSPDNNLKSNKRKKLKLLKASDEADDDEALSRHKSLLNGIVDGHYTKWTFPKRRKWPKADHDESANNANGGEEDDEAS